VDDDFGVGRGLENRAVPHEEVAKLRGIDDVAVMSDGKLPMHAIDENRLCIR
jgi:hypothetical protein